VRINIIHHNGLKGFAGFASKLNLIDPRSNSNIIGYFITMSSCPSDFNSHWSIKKESMHRTLRAEVSTHIFVLKESHGQQQLSPRYRADPCVNKRASEGQ